MDELHSWWNDKGAMACKLDNYRHILIEDKFDFRKKWIPKTKRFHGINYDGEKKEQYYIRRFGEAKK
jgi:hypothetical protein